MITRKPHSQFNENETRYNLIEPALMRAGWNLSDRTQIWFEVPVQGYDASPASGITDYCMFRTNGEVLAVVEAKRTRRDARVGKEQVLRYVTDIEKKQSFQHSTIHRLTKGEAGNLDDLIHLEQTLETELGTDELNLNEDNMLKAFGVGSLTDFLRHSLKLETLPSYEQIVRKAFDAFILEHNYNADQTRFLRTVQTVFMQKRKLEEADSYEAPFTNFGSNAVEKYFTQEEIEELMALTKKLAA